MFPWLSDPKNVLTEEQLFIQQLLDPATQNVAFQRLLKEYERPLYSLIRSIVLDHDDANDVLQNTFVKVFRYLHQFKGDSKLFTWTYRIATNEALSFVKSKAKISKLTSEDLQSRLIDNLESDPYFDGDAIQIKLQKAVASLPEKQQLVFKMRYFEDLKYEDISEILNTSVGALKASYHHASKKVQIFMTAD